MPVCGYLEISPRSMRQRCATSRDVIPGSQKKRLSVPSRSWHAGPSTSRHWLPSYFGRGRPGGSSDASLTTKRARKRENQRIVSSAETPTRYRLSSEDDKWKTKVWNSLRRLAGRLFAFRWSSFCLAAYYVQHSGRDCPDGTRA
jgi:hypothetical protein